MAAKKLGPDTKLDALLKEYPFLEDVLVGLNDRFRLLKNRFMRATAGKIADLKTVASLGGMKLDDLLSALQNAIRERTGESVELGAMSEGEEGDTFQEAMARMEDLLRRLHAGEAPEKLKEEFKAIEELVGPEQIVAVEQRLIEKGVPAGEIQKLCDVHVTLFKGALEAKPIPQVPPGHPVHTYLAENLRFMNLASDLSQRTAGGKDLTDELAQELLSLVETLSKVDLHYVRKENQLFPYMEKHGISGPPQVMWGIHDEIRKELKELRQAILDRDAAKVKELAAKVSRDIVEMAYKEDRILFPMALDALTEEEWAEIRRGEDEIGYCFEGPAADWPTHTSETRESRAAAEGELPLSEGRLSAELINLLLLHLPVDVTFVDEEDTVRYYSASKHRIFPRSPGIIGRKVQNCHPPKSVGIVERILQAFKAGERDVAEFWLQLRGRFIHIRYFAVRDAEGRYRGTLEVSQDVTDIRNLEGERRLLDWDAPA